MRFHDYPAEKESLTDENDDDSDFEVRVSPKKRRFIERVEDQEVQEAPEENFEDECDRDFERIQQKQQMTQKRLRSTG